MHVKQFTANAFKHAWKVAVLGFFLLAGSAHAVLLDWTAVSWTAGSLSNPYDVDATNPGNDITLTVGGDTGQLKNKYPAIDGQLVGQSLHFKADFADNSQGLTVTIAFNYNNWLAIGVENVSFSVFNIDTDGSFIDQIRNISAVNTSGGTVAATTVTGGSATTVSGSGTLGATASGNGLVAASSGNGTVTIDFGTNIITAVTFTIGNDSTAAINPKVQDVAIDNVSFKKHAIPEVSVPAAAAVACAVAILLRRRARRPRAAVTADRDAG